MSDVRKLGERAAAPFDPRRIEEIVASRGRGPEAVIPILQAIQTEFHHLPDAALKRICEIADITPASIAGVSTFYSQFRRDAAGRHTIQVCIGTACHVKGAEPVFDAFKARLGIPENDDTDPDRLFTVEKVACLGCCMLAPAVRIDDVTYGTVSASGVPRILKDFLASRSAPAAARKTKAGCEAGPGGEVRICLCSSCAAAGSARVFETLLDRMGAWGVRASVKVVGCTGFSHLAPLVEIELADGRRFQYARVRPADVPGVLSSHFRPAGITRLVGASATRLLERLLTGEESDPVPRFAVDVRDDPGRVCEKYQVRMATEHAGLLDPVDLDEYRSRNGFEALKRCLAEGSPDSVIRKIQKSGLRGRGGAGYPTGRKWEAVRASGGKARVVICNGDEGDPGAFMDRMLIESFPFRVIEGMAIAAFAVGAEEGVFYVRAEYPLAVKRLREALKLCEARSILGASLMGSGPPLNLKLVEGAGAFVCGEETALISAIEGRRGMPRFRPPYPSAAGLRGAPTLVNNVETLALVPWILRFGPRAFAEIGTGSSAGTKTFALAGKVARGGLIEVPMGMTLGEIVEGIGGGVQEGKRLKAVQVGGPSGGCVPARLADTPVDYEALASAGAMMGSGGLVVLDEEDCMVDVARYFLSFTQRESCGKCTFCRIGTKRMLEILEGLCEGRGEPSDLKELKHLAKIVREGSLCGLGRSAPNPVLSTLEHFRGEYEAHVEGRCPAGKCRALITYRITDDCIGCTRCAQRCPADAIEMRPYEKHEIDPEKCLRCGTCRQACPEDAVKVE